MMLRLLLRLERILILLAQWLAKKIDRRVYQKEDHGIFWGLE